MRERGGVGRGRERGFEERGCAEREGGERQDRHRERQSQKMIFEEKAHVERELEDREK